MTDGILKKFNIVIKGNQQIKMILFWSSIYKNNHWSFFIVSVFWCPFHLNGMKLDQIPNFD